MTEDNNDDSKIHAAIHARIHAGLCEAWNAGFQCAVRQMQELAADPALTDPHSRRHLETIVRLLMKVKPN